MSLTEDLARLKELDPATWQEINHVTQMISSVPITARWWGDQLGSDGNKPIRENLALAWLQWCLQEAIATRDRWTYSVFRIPESWNYCADVSRTAPGYDGDCWNEYHEYLLAEREADTPAAALLKAYIAALEAQP